MEQRTLQDWDDAFANMAHITGSESLPAYWQATAQSYRQNDIQLEEVAYGDHERGRFDLIWPDPSTKVKGLAVFVHGGYWMRLDKSYWTHLAEGARRHGWAVCLPSYTLTPDARIADITQQIASAIRDAAARIDGPIRLAGHSAGGHLVCRMVCEDTTLDPDILSRITNTLSISGLHDLRPLLHTAMNETLHLDLREAQQESPALLMPLGNPHVHVWVGGGERSEFLRQAELLNIMWSGLDAHIQHTVDEKHHHFSVIEGLRDPASAITRAFIGCEL